MDAKINDVLAQMRAMAAAAQNQPVKPAATAPGGVDFGGLVANAIRGVNNQQQQAEKLATAFELGDPKVSLADVMLQMQKANISFQAMTQVRNKLVQAYQDVMSMPI
jgi:flagellar hook-basal body complex protein FliE